MINRPAAHSTCIIGVGTEFRHDDAVGLIAARRLSDLDSDHVLVSEGSGEGTDLMRRWSGADRVFVIDAVRSGAAPGTVHRLSASREPMPRDFFSYSTHAFGLAESVELCRALGQLPARLVIYGIEGRDFSTGQGITSEVEEGLKQVVARIRRLAETENWASSPR